MQPLRAILRRSDRVRGTGWLDCPNCHEHASQDVVDEMTFACFTFYRLSPVHRQRVLVCRRCAFRRPAEGAEMSHLETSGHRIQRAVMAPIGLTPFLAAGLIAFIVINHNTDVIAGVTFNKQDSRPVADITFQLPTDYNHSTDVDTVPNTYTATNPSGTLVMHLRRIVVKEPVDQLLAEHFADDKSTFQDNDFPDTVDMSKVTKVKVGGNDALRWQFTYKHANDAAEEAFYAFLHNGVSYTISFEALGQGIIDSYGPIEKKIIDSMDFSGNKETPAPAASPSPGSSPAAGGSPAPAASPSPSPH